MTTFRFRPQELSKKYLIKERLKYGRVENYNWQTRTNWLPANMTKNRVSIVRRWQQIHHFSSHTAKPAQHWVRANRMFERQFLGTYGQGSMRYLNKWSAHSWL